MGLTLLASPADAAKKLCRDRHRIPQRLEQKHEEKSHALGLSVNAEVIEVLVPPAGGWNMLVTSPKKPTRVLAVGEAWQVPLLIGGRAARGSVRREGAASCHHA
jgi:hypothetical protein